VKALRFHPEAESELTAAHDWYSARSGVAAQAFALEFDHAIVQILHAPSRHPVGRRRTPIRPASIFYTILYRIRADHVFVTAVAHESRRPGYWHCRG
jgi:toxin ParE1/3/4